MAIFPMPLEVVLVVRLNCKTYRFLIYPNVYIERCNFITEECF